MTKTSGYEPGDKVRVTGYTGNYIVGPGDLPLMAVGTVCKINKQGLATSPLGNGWMVENGALHKAAHTFELVTPAKQPAKDLGAKALEWLKAHISQQGCVYQVHKDMLRDVFGLEVKKVVSFEFVALADNQDTARK